MDDDDPDHDPDAGVEQDAERAWEASEDAKARANAEIVDAEAPCPFGKMPCGKHLCDTPQKCPNAYIPPCETGLPPLTKQDNTSILV
jgi:hypothetical protein